MRGVDQTCVVGLTSLVMKYWLVMIGCACAAHESSAKSKAITYFFIAAILEG